MTVGFVFVFDLYSCPLSLSRSLYLHTCLSLSFALPQAAVAHFFRVKKSMGTPFSIIIFFYYY